MELKKWKFWTNINILTNKYKYLKFILLIRLNWINISLQKLPAKY